MYIISATDFPLFCSNFARKCLILPAECSLQKSLILLEILPAEFIQAYTIGFGLACHWLIKESARTIPTNHMGPGRKAKPKQARNYFQHSI